MTAGHPTSRCRAAPGFDTPSGRLAFVADPFGAASCPMDPIELPGA